MRPHYHNNRKSRNSDPLLKRRATGPRSSQRALAHLEAKGRLVGRAFSATEALVK
jgi:hypothetical protein